MKSGRDYIILLHHMVLWSFMYAQIVGGLMSSTCSTSGDKLVAEMDDTEMDGEVDNAEMVCFWSYHL